MHDRSSPDYVSLARHIKEWGVDLGFSAVGIARAELGEAEARLMDWLSKGYHGDMDYMVRHAGLRAKPNRLVAGAASVINVRLDYLPLARDALAVMEEKDKAYVSRYALGRDYHKVLRGRLQRLADRIASEIGAFGYRCFTDSAPVMEVELARLAGLGWRGKHTLLLGREGSWFFLGEIVTDLPLPTDAPVDGHCGTCQACIDICPTRAIVAPYVLDARRCISYLTIEHPGAIPEDLRLLMGNRVYGCDDCQLVCPWNRFAGRADDADFAVRHGLDDVRLVDLFAWEEAEFDRRFTGSAIRRIGHERWLRNLAVALGNAPTTPDVIAALKGRRDHPSLVVREHVEWALSRHRQ
jgi:epoxyqueuosine reductase